MFSNNIYGAFPTTTIGPFHYLYRITNLVEQKHYYGIRTSRNILPHQDLGIKYFSSSRDQNFKKDQKEHPENCRYKVVIVTNSRKRVAELEMKIHQKFNVGTNPKFYNKAKHTSTGFDVTGKAVMRDQDGNITQVSVDDPRIASGELYSAWKGKTVMCDSDGNISYVSIYDPRIATGELQSVNKGKLMMRDKNGNCISVPRDDQRIATGELVGSTKGKVVMRDSDGKNHSVLTSDPRIASGELQHINKGKAIFRDKDGNCIQVSNDDPRISTGELYSITKGKSVMRNQDGNCIQVSSDDPRITTGELCGIGKGKVNMQDSNGNHLRVSTSDPRIATGEIFSIYKGLTSAKDRMGNIKLISKDSLEWKTGCFVGIMRRYIFITPFGKIINDFTKFPFTKLSRICIQYNDYPITKIIFERYKLYLEELFNFDEIEGKTFKELGFGVEPWLMSQSN